MDTGYIARKIGLGDVDLLKGYSSLDELIDGELHRPAKFLAPKHIGDIPEEWPERFTFSLTERVNLKMRYEREADKLEKLGLEEQEFERRWRQLWFENLVDDRDQYKFFHAHTFSPNQLNLRLSMFWFNHFTIGMKGETHNFIGHSWAQILSLLDGSFKDLLYYSICHPGMLSYLDNIYSFGPRSERGRNDGVSLNDNLARELLELHTVSPAAQYSEKDIHEAAKVLTGWGAGGFDYKWSPRPSSWKEAWRRNAAEPGRKIVLGKSIASGKKGLRELTDFLSAHPDTIKHLSQKLLLHFVGPSYTAEQLESTSVIWAQTDGSLKAIHKHVLGLAIESRFRSVKWPLVWFFQMLRVSSSQLFLGFDQIRKSPLYAYYLANRLMNFSHEIGQDFWSTRQPDGFSSNQSDWVSNEHFDRRIRLAGLVYDHGSPKKSTDNILIEMGFGDHTKNMLNEVRDERDKFILLMCSPEMMDS